MVQQTCTSKSSSKSSDYKPLGYLFCVLVLLVDVGSPVASFSDCQVGVATQCLKSNKCFKAKPQYYANVCLKYVLTLFITPCYYAYI